MSYLTTKSNDSFAHHKEILKEKNQSDLILKMGLIEFILHATVLLLLV